MSRSAPGEAQPATMAIMQLARIKFRRKGVARMSVPPIMCPAAKERLTH